MDLKTYLDACRLDVDSLLATILPSAEEPPTTLHRAMRHAVLAGGKRLRPALCLATAEALNGDRDRALQAGAAVELLHAYTLVHDDLPCMDNDDERRGQPTVHIAFGEANAVLAGDALQALAFETLATVKPAPPWTGADLVLELARAGGGHGVVGGQVEDMAAVAGPLSRDMLTFIHIHKTAVLFRAAVRLGAMTAGADGAPLEALAHYALNLGVAFQITDDLLDAPPEGAPSHEVSCLRLDTPQAARQHAETLIASARDILRFLPPERRRTLDAMAAAVLNRTH